MMDASPIPATMASTAWMCQPPTLAWASFAANAPRDFTVTGKRAMPMYVLTTTADVRLWCSAKMNRVQRKAARAAHVHLAMKRPTAARSARTSTVASQIHVMMAFDVRTSRHPAWDSRVIHAPPASPAMALHALISTSVPRRPMEGAILAPNARTFPARARVAHARLASAARERLGAHR